MNQGFNQVEELIAKQSAANVDTNLRKMAQMPSAQMEIPWYGHENRRCRGIIIKKTN